MAGAVGARSRSSRASSTPPCDAASISTTSRCEPAAIRRHCSHLPHGSGVGPCSQLTILARIRAVDVLPVPRGPQNRYAWAMRFSRTAPTSARTTCSCPRTSSGVCGRYFRYSDWYSSATAVGLPGEGFARNKGGDRATAVDRTENSGAHQAGGSGQASLRHPPAPAYRCFLPDLTGFASWRRAGPSHRRPGTRGGHGPSGPRTVFGLARADCEYRAPLVPHLARSPRSSIRGGPDSPESDRLPVAGRGHGQDRDHQQDQHDDREAPALPLRSLQRRDVLRRRGRARGGELPRHGHRPIGQRLDPEEPEEPSHDGEDGPEGQRSTERGVEEIAEAAEDVHVVDVDEHPCDERDGAHAEDEVRQLALRHQLLHEWAGGRADRLGGRLEVEHEEGQRSDPHGPGQDV